MMNDIERRRPPEDCQVLRSGANVAHSGDAEGPLLSVMLGDRHILALAKAVPIELEDRLIVAGIVAVIMKRPPAAAMNQAPMFFAF